MNSRQCRPVPGLALLAALPLLGFAGCAPDIDARNDALVVTDGGTTGYNGTESPERTAAVAEMRVNAEAGDILPYPGAFQSEQTRQLAARDEPRAVSEADSIEAELAAIARRQASAISPQEIAALKAREAELRRLAAQRIADAPR